MVINPMVQMPRNNEDGVNSLKMDVFSANLDHRVIHLTGEIDDEMAASVVSQFLCMDYKNTDPIYLYINSPGGSVSAGFAIYDTMKFIRSEVVTICIGRAASMGALLLAGGQRGKRFILAHSEVMIHQPSGGMEGQSSDLMIAADHIKETRNVINEILSEETGKSYEDIARDTERDHWMKADEAVKYGLVDKVIHKPENMNER